MSLNVQAMVAGNRFEKAECILCGTCVDTCPERAIGFTWRDALLHSETHRCRIENKQVR